MQFYDNSKDDQLFLNMLAKRRINQSSKQQDHTGESLRKVFRNFESSSLENQIIVSNFPEFQKFIEYRLNKSVSDFEKYISNKKD